MALNWLGNAASTVANTAKGAASAVTNTAGGALNSLKNGISGSVSKLADEAADMAADTALAPLNLIEKSLSQVSSLGPEIVAKRRAQINTMLSGIEAAALKHDSDVEARKLADAKLVVEARVRQIRVDTSVPKEIKDKYELILEDKNATPDSLIDSLANVDDELLVYENKELNVWRLVKRAWRLASDYIYYILLFTCILFGGIIISNVHIHETFLPIRIYYFIYGTAFFPASLLYGIVNPPEWNAKLFPVYQIVENRRMAAPPTVGGAPPNLSSEEAAAAAAAAQRGREVFGKNPAGATVNADVALDQAASKGITGPAAAHDAIDAIMSKGTTEAVAKQQVASELEKRGVPPAVALRTVSTPRPPTLLQRLIMIQNELFGYKLAGGQTIVLRIISAILAGSTTAWAYYRGDLNDLITLFRKRMAATSVTAV